MILRKDLMEDLHYDPETGVWTWKTTRGKAVQGARAGCPPCTGYDYWRIRVRGRTYTANRLAWFYMTGEWPPAGMMVDHWNVDPADDRWVNLRLATMSQNQCNRGANTNNTSGFKGVEWDSRRECWRARIKIGRKDRFLGYYESAEVAAVAYAAAARLFHGEFARN